MASQQPKKTRGETSNGQGRASRDEVERFLNQPRAAVPVDLDGLGRVWVRDMLFEDEAKLDKVAPAERLIRAVISCTYYDEVGGPRVFEQADAAAIRSKMTSGRIEALILGLNQAREMGKAR